MANKVLLDVNVCLDVLLKRLPHFDNAGRIFQAVEDGTITALVSVISFDTLFYLLRPSLGSLKAQKELLRLRKHIGVASIGTEIIDHALHAGWKDFEDALHYYSAESNHCDAIISRNKKDFPEDASVPIYTPKEFIETQL